jgi:hypothetical protein
MSTTDLTAVANQIQKFWAPQFTKQLRESLLLGGLVNKQYQGEIKRQGDTVRVSQINAPTGQLLTVGTNADSFNSEAISTSYVDIKADKRAVASYEFQDLVELQSQVGQGNPEVMEALMFAMQKQINTYLYSLVSASTSSPDHNIGSVSDFNASQLAAARVLAAQAKWRMEPGWYALLDPVYMGDIMNAATLTSSDYGASDAPVIGGQVALKRFGFNLLEDNSLSADHALLFHPDFMHMVSQTDVQVKVSDLHSQKKFGIVMSVDMVFGAALGVNGNVKHIQVYNSAW